MILPPVSEGKSWVLGLDTSSTMPEDTSVQGRLAVCAESVVALVLAESDRVS